MSWVRPGVELVRARPRVPSKLFIKLDLPTLDRPVNATSGSRSAGNCSGEVALLTNCALVIFNLVAGNLVAGRAVASPCS